MKIRWTTQNEVVDADVFLLEGAASFAAECALLKEWHCPEPTVSPSVPSFSLRVKCEISP